MSATANESTALKTRLIFGLIVLAIIGRLIPHPDNFTPLAGMALFVGALLPGWRAAAAVLIALVVSDLLLGFLPDHASLAVYGCFLVSIALGRWLADSRGGRTWMKTGFTALSGSLLFFIVTNFAVWLAPHAFNDTYYAHTWEGLMECYSMALPFLRNAIAGDLFWTALLFGLYDFGYTRIKPAQAT